MTYIDNADYYPYDLDPDGGATCWQCGGDAPSCSVCGGDGFIDAEAVTRFCQAARAEDEAHQASVDRFRILYPLPDPPPDAEEPF